jgi:hypothetical protein
VFSHTATYGWAFRAMSDVRSTCRLCGSELDTRATKPMHLRSCCWELLIPEHQTATREAGFKPKGKGNASAAGSGAGAAVSSGGALLGAFKALVSGQGGRWGRSDVDSAPEAGSSAEEGAAAAAVSSGTSSGAPRGKRGAGGGSFQRGFCRRGRSCCWRVVCCCAWQARRNGAAGVGSAYAAAATAGAGKAKRSHTGED